MYPSALVVLEGVADEIVLLQPVSLRKALSEVVQCVALLATKGLKIRYNQSVKGYDVES